MHYLAALRSGMSVDNLSRGFAQELVIASVNAGELCFQFTSDFVNDTLLAIGLVSEITPDQIGAENPRYQWPKEQMQTYIFHRNEFEFRCVEQFLVAMSRAVAYINPECYDEIVATNHDEMRDFETPVEYFMEMIAVWCNVYKHLLAASDYGTPNMFLEPLARINLHLFVGVHDLRIAYRQYFSLLDNICSRLYSSALEGLRYPLAHEITVQALLKIVSQDFDLFPEDVALFFHGALVVKCDSSTYLKIFQELYMMLESNHDNRLQILTNILINQEMIEICYNVLVSKKGKFITRQQQKVLKFLDVLQSKLQTLDCFSREFIESVLNLVARTKHSTASLACKLYMDIMKRKVTEEVILIHILEFYVNHVGNTSFLSNYVSQFYNNFEFVRNVYKFLDIISWAATSDSLRLLCAHSVIAIFKIKFEGPDTSGTADAEIQSLLLILPEMLKKLPCQQTIGILLQLFEFVAFESLEKQTMDNFIHYAVDAFQDLDNKFEYPLLMNIFIIFNKCLDVVKEWQHLELMGNFLMIEYSKSIKTLESIKPGNKMNPSKSCFQRLCCIVKRVNVVIKSRYEVFDFLTGLINSLEKYVLTKYSIDFIGSNELNQATTFIDIYALEVVTSCIIKLSKEETNHSVYTSHVYRRAQQISEHLKQFLKDGEQFLKLPAFRMKTYFCSLLNLYCHLPLKISNETYFHMTQILISLNLVTKPGGNQNAAVQELQQTHLMQENEYIRVMFRHFGEFHKYDHVEIKSNIIWKLCLHFGKRESRFNEELKDLLIILATYRFDIYKHIIAVLVYNLYRQRPPLNGLIITLLLRKHKHFIDTELTVESSKLLKVHVVLLVLQIIEKALVFQRIDDRYNRIEALKQLNIFMEDLGLSALESKQLVIEQADLLKKHLLTPRERKILNNFLLEVQKI